MLNVGLTLFETGYAEDIDVVRPFTIPERQPPLTAEEMGDPLN
jgi:hypothetical protein